MKLTKEELSESMKSLKDWAVEGNNLVKVFEFDNFRTAFSMMTQIAFIAEKLNHHPDWSNSYNKVTVSLSTHSEGGITQKDIGMAKEIDKITFGFDKRSS